MRHHVVCGGLRNASSGNRLCRRRPQNFLLPSSAPTEDQPSLVCDSLSTLLYLCHLCQALGNTTVAQRPYAFSCGRRCIPRTLSTYLCVQESLELEKFYWVRQSDENDVQVWAKSTNSVQVQAIEVTCTHAISESDVHRPL